MTASMIGLRRGIGIFVCAGIIVLVAAFAGLFRAAPLEASVGESFLAIPGLADGNQAHRGNIAVLGIADAVDLTSRNELAEPLVQLPH